MASGCLLLVPVGLGMDMYATPNWNCLEISNDCDGIANGIFDAVTNLSNYRLIRENGVRTAKEWTWKKSVLAHMYFYEMIAKGKSTQLFSGYRFEYREIIKNFENISDVEKIHFSEQERIGIYRFLNKYLQKKVLVLTGCYEAHIESIPENVTIISILNENKDGVYVRPECLPFDDKTFDVVLVVGAWETIVEPCAALIEMERIAKSDVVILYHKGYPFFWQNYQFENDDEWKEISSSKWDCSFDDIINCRENYDISSMYKIIHYSFNVNC